jgi:hypothetical protein
MTAAAASMAAANHVLRQFTSPQTQCQHPVRVSGPSVSVYQLRVSFAERPGRRFQLLLSNRTPFNMKSIETDPVVEDSKKLNEKSMVCPLALQETKLHSN